jgi:hypothetical protein
VALPHGLSLVEQGASGRTGIRRVGAARRAGRPDTDVVTTEDRKTVATPDAAQRGAPSPAVLWLPGTLMLWFGVWGVVEGSVAWAWGVWPVGLALLIVGGVAQGVVWGMDIHKERHP